MKTKHILIPVCGAAALALTSMVAIGGSGEGHKGHGNWFQKLDTDSNGTISQAEINAAGNKHFDKLDADGDGQLSKQEFNARKVKMLNRADADENGEISKDEWDAAKQKMRERHGKKKGS